MLIITGLISLALSILLVPRIVKLSQHLHLYDMPDSRKVHKLPIPRLGGVVFLPIAILAVATVLSVAMRLGVSSADLTAFGSTKHFVAYVAGAFMLYLVGLWDDIAGVGYQIKFLVQILAAFILCISGLWIASLEYLFFINDLPFWVGMPLSILFVVYVTNAINLIDGIDGLASGLSMVSLSVIAILCFMSGDILWAMVAVAFIGSLLAFFCYNVFGGKNKIFMGDAGSLTLGFTLSFMVLHFWQNRPVWNPILHNVGIVVISTLVIPMFDVVRVMMSRLRDGRNPFLPDKNHIHHKLLRAGFSGRQTMIALLVISAGIITTNYIVSEISQTLMIFMDIFIYFVMHRIINRLIVMHEKKTGFKWSRELFKPKKRISFFSLFM